MIAVETAPTEAPKRRGRAPKQKLSPIQDAEIEDASEETETETAENAEDSREIPPYPPINAITTGEALLDYWNARTSDQRKKGNLYLQRLWPMPNLVVKRGRPVNESIDKYSDEDGPISRETIWSKYRAGIYRIRMVQRVTKPFGQISMADWELNGDLMDPLEMPMIAPEDIDLDYPGNQGYIKILKSRGILKPEEEEEDMAAQAAVGQILNHAVDQMLKPKEPSPTPVQASNDGALTALVGLVKEQINHNRPPAEQGTVQENLAGLVSLAKVMIPTPAPQPDNGPYLTLLQENNKLVLAMKEQEVIRAQNEAANMRQEIAILRESIPKPKTTAEQFAELEQAHKLYARMTGRGKDEESEEVKPAENPMTGFWGNIGPVLENIKAIVGLGANIYYNWKVNGDGMPTNPVTNQPSNEPEAPDTQEALPPAVQKQMEEMEERIEIFKPMFGPMIQSLDKKETGAQFAAQVIQQFGPDAFQAMKTFPGGRLAIIGFLKPFPPAWNKLKHRLIQFETFLDEFLKYEPPVAPVPIR